jgi:hypothetical protein
MLAAGQAAWLWQRPPDVVERVVWVNPPPKPVPLPEPEPQPRPETPPTASPGADAVAVARAWEEGLRLRQEVLQNGVAALPAPQAWPAAPPSAGEDVFGLPGGVLTPRQMLRPFSEGEETR